MLFGVLSSSCHFAYVVKGVFYLVCVTLYPWTVFFLLFWSFFHQGSHQPVMSGCDSFCADFSEAQSPRVSIEPMTFWLECHCTATVLKSIQS